VFERVRANMHERGRQRVCSLMQEFRKHERGVLSASSGRGDALQKIVEYSYGLRGQRKWAFHRAYNLSMHHKTVSGPPWPAAEYDQRFGWKAEVKGQIVVMQTASPLPLPLLEHLHEMMGSRPRAERRMYESIVHVPRTPLVQHAFEQLDGEAARRTCDESLGISVGKDDFSIVDVKQNRRSKARFKRKTKNDRKYLTNGDLASVCKTLGRGLAEDNAATGKSSSKTVSVRVQLKDALLQLRKAREELRLLQTTGQSVAVPIEASAVHAGMRGCRMPPAGCDDAASVTSAPSPPAALEGARSGRVQYAAPPHPLAVIPGTKPAAAAAAARAASAVSLTSKSSPAKQFKELRQNKAT
jgi:hypothetical protein